MINNNTWLTFWRASLDNLRLVQTPMEANVELYSENDIIPNAPEYRRVIGMLQYLILTCPDICHEQIDAIMTD